MLVLITQNIFVLQWKMKNFFFSQQSQGEVRFETFFFAAKRVTYPPFLLQIRVSK